MPYDPALRRRQVSGLLWVAIIVLLAAAARAPWSILFAPGWWRVW